MSQYFSICCDICIRDQRPRPVRGFFMPEIQIRLAVVIGQSYMCVHAQ